MAKLSAHGYELYRYACRRGLVSVRSDGYMLLKPVYSKNWKLFTRKKKDVPLEKWIEWKMEKLANIRAERPWALVNRLPSVRQLEKWAMDGVCETPDGHTVEPDGTAPNGAPSWLRILGMV